MDLFRRVPQELVKIWEKQSLQGLKQKTLEEVYAEWRRLNFTFTLIKMGAYVLIACIGVTALIAFSTILGLVVPDRQDVKLQAATCVLLLCIVVLMSFVVNSDNFKSMVRRLEWHEQVITDFNTRVQVLLVLRRDSFNPPLVREHLYLLAHDVVVAERRVDAVNDSDAKPEDIRLAQRQLEHTRKEFEPYFTTVHFFAEYFDPPNRRRIFQTVDEEIDRQK